MAADTVTTQPPKPAPKRRNKKSTADAKIETTSAQDTDLNTPSIDGDTAKADEQPSAYENPHVKELQKNIRNVTKKLTSMSKVDAILAESPSIPLDELVAARKINADQKAQVLKKPALQAQLNQYESELSVHKQLEEDVSKRLQAQKEKLDAEHQRELAEYKTSAASTAAVREEAKPDVRAPLLILSKFLRAAAARRQDSDENSEDSKGFEGVLLLLYGGDEAAVDAAEKLINGSSDAVPSTEGGDTEVTFDRVKQLATEYAPFASEEAWVNGVADASKLEADVPPSTDPTIATAGLNEATEIADDSTPRLPPDSAASLPEQGSTEPSSANQAASAHPTEPLAESWVSVPRAPEETETPTISSSTNISSTIVPPNQADQWADTLTTTNQTESWADSPVETPTPAPAGDGFHEVHHGRGGRGRGAFEYGGRGRGRGGGGFRGDERGRGGHGGRGRAHDGRGGGRGGRGRGGREAGPPHA